MERSSKILISHRGNIAGPNTAKYGENHPNSILYALGQGFDCEVDVRWIDGKYFLGHNKPEYEIDKKFLYNHKLYIHCKTVETIYKLDPRPFTFVKLFFHQNDDIVQIINSVYFWSYPRASVMLTSKSIAVLPELVPNWQGLENVAGLCSDYVEQFQKDICFRI